MPTAIAFIIIQSFIRYISVFSHLTEDDDDFIDAQRLHLKKYSLMSSGEYLENLANRPNPNELIFRSNDTMKYLSITESKNLLMDWLIFQFGNKAADFIELFYNWLNLKNFKEGGLAAHGVPNCGKSYFLASVCDCFIAVGRVRPNKGYTFNFDDCYGKQIVCCDEFLLDENDLFSRDTLKDITAGSAASIKMKGKCPVTLQPVPWLFLSNDPQFDMALNPNNPWLSRIHQVKLKFYTNWNERTRAERLNPYAWIEVFKTYGHLV